MNMDTIIKDYLDIIQDIELQEGELLKPIGWIYKRTFYNYYKKKLLKSLDKLDFMVLTKDNVQELVYYIANTFATENGTFNNIYDAKTTTFKEGTKEEYTMYTTKVKVGDSSIAEIKTYSNNPEMEINYHSKIVDIKSNSSSFTVKGEMVKLEDGTTNGNYKKECITLLNIELCDSINKYIRWCMNNYKGE